MQDKIKNELFIADPSRLKVRTKFINKRAGLGITEDCSLKIWVHTPPVNHGR